MKKTRSIFLGAVTGASLLAQGGSAAADEIIRCIKVPNEYPLQRDQECVDDVGDQNKGPYTS